MRTAWALREREGAQRFAYWRLHIGVCSDSFFLSLSLFLSPSAFSVFYFYMAQPVDRGLFELWTEVQQLWLRIQGADVDGNGALCAWCLVQWVFGY